MKILALDPGETTGYVILEILKGDKMPAVLQLGEVDTKELIPATIRLQQLIIKTNPGRIVLEDYRVYQNAAGLHIGMRLHTPELIGAIVAICALFPDYCSSSIARLPASKKGRWPNARLDARMPPNWRHRIHSAHALDALKIGLAYWEMEAKDV